MRTLPTVTHRMNSVKAAHHCVWCVGELAHHKNKNKRNGIGCPGSILNAFDESHGVSCKKPGLQLFDKLTHELTALKQHT